jgi:NADPH:quinone reductase-like Zn-dependent oxidoreductase
MIEAMPMKAIQLTQPSLDAFQTVRLDDPSAGPGEVLVRMKAASLNYIDVALAAGAYPGASYPVIPVADGAGEIVALGASVTGLAVGDRVAIHPKCAWAAGRPTAHRARIMRGVTAPGALRELASVSADTVVKLPDHLSWEQAAAIPITATTAWNALKAANIGPGNTVAVLGTGGSSVFTIQLAKARGATVIVTSSSDEKLERARGLGADHFINYRAQPHWDEAVRDITGGLGADLVLDTAGAQTIDRSLKAARHGGTVFTIGFLTGGAASIDLMLVIVNSLRVLGNNTGSAEDLAEAVAAIAAHRIEPVVDRVFALDSLRDAYEMLGGAKSHFGKLAISLEAWQ